MGSVKMGRPVSQHLEFGGPDVADEGEELRAPGGIVVDTPILAGPEAGAGADVGDGGVDVTLFCK
jgi:hypothetical protein